MNHSEAQKEMAAERYLLDELSPEARDAFEEHMFGCPECALDVRSGTTFLSEAKAQLPTIGLGSPAASKTRGAGKTSMLPEKDKRWFTWLRPAFAVPAMAALLVVVGYQNLVTLPALRRSADQPHIVKVAPLYGATRGGSRVVITADRANGIALPVELPVDSSFNNYASFSLELSNPQGKSVWTSSVPAPAQNANSDMQLSIVVPGAMLENGTYVLTVLGIGAHGEKTEAGRYVFDIALAR
jgi:hypothetical protein